MELATIETDKPTTRQAIEAQDRSLPGRVTGKLKRALDAMIYEGKSRKEAAEAAGMVDHGLYAAFRKPHVKAYYAAGLEVLRSSERARNIHALIEVRDQTGNQMARVQAVKALEQLADEAQRTNGSGAPMAPGLTVVVNVGHGTQIAQPEPIVIENDDGSST